MSGQASQQGHRTLEHEEWNQLWARPGELRNCRGLHTVLRDRGGTLACPSHLHSLLWFLKASSSSMPLASSSLRAASISFSRRWTA